MEISWGEEGALGLFVTTPGASIPLGPGQVVQNGTALWALSTAKFPEGFNGPVTYGQLPDGASDITEENGGSQGGEVLENDCYTIHVVTESFLIGSHSIELSNSVQPISN